VPLASSIRDRLLVDRYAAEHQLIRQDLDETDPTQLQRIHAYFNDKNGMPPLGSSTDYSAAFDLCLPDPNARRALLRELIDNVKPAFGQRLFGGLVVAGACDLVITTNFDRLIEQAVSEAHRAGTNLDLPLQRELNVAGLDSTVRASAALQDRQWPLAVKLHGDFREKKLMNTDEELQQQDASMRQFVVDVSRQFGLAVSGYSGRDRSVMEMLETTVRTVGAWPYGIWWFCRPDNPIPGSVRNLLSVAAQNGIEANLVVAAGFDETMSALARQVVVDEPMREYFNRLHPKRRSTPASVPSANRQWPVLRFNALPVHEASAELTRIVIPAEWNRRTVRSALAPRADWPVVVNGPGEVICPGDPDAALALLTRAGAEKSLPAPGPASTIHTDLLADNAPFHHQTVLLHLIAHALQQVLPVRMQTDRHGSPELIVTAPAVGEPAEFPVARTRLNRAYEDKLFGYLSRTYGRTAEGKDRWWAEEVQLSFDKRAGRSWLLFTPNTWVSPWPVIHPPKRTDIDPANSWRAEQWAQRRFNERWAEIIRAWSALISPDEPTVLETTCSATGTARPARIILGRTNAYSRPA